MTYDTADIEGLRKKGYRFAQLEMPDLNGTLRGKIAGLEKGLSPGGSGMSTLTLSARSADNICYTDFSGIHNGFPKMVAKPDFATLRPLPWTGDTVGLLFDFYMDDGTPCPVDTRHILKRTVEETEALGLKPKVALEFEVYIFHEDEAIEQRAYDKLKPFGRTKDFYYLTRFPSYIDLAKEFLGRMEDIGIPVEAFHTEYGKGMFEYMLAPMPPLEAADAAMRTKLYLKQLCAERGLVASFMPVPQISDGDTALGLHHNLSLWRDGKNICWDETTGTLSQTARHFAGGMIETLPDLHVLFRPWINSYRRMDPDAFSPISASWGLDNHTAAIRVVHGALPAKQSRFEHRVAGTDVNPYLTLAAVLAGGNLGVKDGIEPVSYGEGNVVSDTRFVPLSRTLAEAADQFGNSAIARSLFGNVFVDHFAATRKDEIADFSEWCARNGQAGIAGAVTAWEYDHYLEWA